MNLFTAHNQWANRPSDERFADVSVMQKAARDFESGLVERESSLSRFHVFDDQQGVGIRHNDSETKVHLSYRAFAQICSKVGAPAGYLRSLSDLGSVGSGLVSDQLNALIGNNVDPKDESVFLLHKNGRWDALAMTSQRYDRVSNSEVIGFTRDLVDASPYSWHNPPAYDRGPNGEWLYTMSPSGLYLSQSDCFIFMVSEDQAFQLPGASKPIIRGFMVSNDITGGGSLKMTVFLCDMVCGNHIIWGAREVRSVNQRHIGTKTLATFMRKAGMYLPRVTGSAATSDEAVIRWAAQNRIDDNADKVVENVAKWADVSVKQAAKALDTAKENEHQHGDPLSYWGMASGLTQLSRGVEYADQRAFADLAAGKVLDVAAEVMR